MLQEAIDAYERKGIVESADRARLEQGPVGLAPSGLMWPYARREPGGGMERLT